MLVLFIILALVAATLALAVFVLTRETQVVAEPDPTTQRTPTPSEDESPAVPVGPSPSSERETEDEPPSAPETNDPGTVLPPVAAGTLGEPYNSGTHFAEPGDLNFDFDNGGRGTNDAEISFDRFGITGLRGVPLSVYGDDQTPILADCAATPPDEWVLTIRPSQLTPGTHICYFTNGGRYGYMTVQDVGLTTSGDLDWLDTTFLVWKGRNDS